MDARQETAYASLRSVQAQYDDTHKRLVEARRELSDVRREEAAKRLTERKDKATIRAAGVAMISLIVALLAYLDNERSKSLERTYKLIEAANADYSDTARFKLYRHFAGRFGYSEAKGEQVKPMDENLKARLLAVSKPDSPVYQMPFEQNAEKAAPIQKTVVLQEDLEAYNAARRHLNTLYSFAFAYVYDTADRETIATAMCPTMVKSHTYFAPLIGEFRKEVGRAQSWQLIEKATKKMQEIYGPECRDLFGKRSSLDRLRARISHFSYSPE